MIINKIGNLNLSVFDKVKNKLKIYPIPSKNGKFNLCKSSNWKIY